MTLLLCLVAALHDADTLTCATGERIRLAGIEASELHGGCHLPRCAPLDGQAARAVATRLLLRQTLACEPLGTSWRRIVARCSLNGRDVGCALISLGAAAPWPKYRQRYGLGECK